MEMPSSGRIAGRLLLSLALPLVAQAAPQEADLVLLDANIWTVDPGRPRAEALAVVGDRIVAVGSEAEVGAFVGDETRVVDLDGAFVAPGFNDGHVHVDSTGRLIVGVNLLDVHTQAPLVERVAAATRRLPEGSWILRGDWGAYEQWGQGSSGAPARTVRRWRAPSRPIAT